MKIKKIHKLNIKFQKGFTLIELLVVIAIIGLLSSVVLASLNNARAKGRDAKRVSDLRQVQIALEFYYDSHNSYPACTSFSPWNATTWQNPGTPSTICLYNALVPTYIGSLPTDPTNREGGTGNFLGDNAPTDQGYFYDSTNGISYVLGTNLEKGGTASSSGNWKLTN